MTRVLLVRTSMLSEVNACVTHPLGLMYLAAVLEEKGYAPRIHDLRVEPKGLDGLYEVCASYEPQIVGISCLTAESDQMNQVARRIRKEFPATRIIVGGPHATAYPEQVLTNEAVDMVVMGEGERTLLQLLAPLEKGEVPTSVKGTGLRLNGGIRLNDRQPYVENLDELPFPAWDLIPLEAYGSVTGMSTLNPRSYMTLFTSRSCPYGCIYCHQVFGKGFRARSPENVIQEIETLVKRYNIRSFDIVDDIFNLDPARAKKICNLIIEKGLDVSLAFPNALRADILSEPLIRSLKEAGTVSSAFAIETASPRLQKLVRKNLNLEKARNAINFASDMGILSTGFFMLGFPTETREEMMATIRFASSLRLHTAQFFIVTPFEGTPMAEQFKEQYANLDVDLAEYDYIKGTYNLSEVASRELYRLQRYANLRFYFNPSRMWRILKNYPDKRAVFRRALKMFKVKIFLAGR